MKHISNVVEEHELIYMIRQRDDIALHMMIELVELRARQIIKRYYSPLTRLDKNDYMQIAMAKLVHTIEEFREDKEASFLYFYDRVLRHTFTDMKRVSKRMIATYSMEYAYEKKIMDQPPTYFEYEDKQNIDMLSYHIDLAKIMNALNKNEQNIVIMRLQGYAYREIAKKMNISIKKVDNTLRKIRKRKV